MDIKGGVAIVTGSATGLGAEVARQLAAKGCNVAVNYSKSEDAARETAADCEALGVETILCRADVGEDLDCRRLVAQTMDKWGRVDALVNNAGTTKLADQSDLDALDADDFLRVYRVNVIGPYQMVRAVAPHMKAAGSGAVVNVSSIAGVKGIGSSIAYAASKGALNTMTLSLARSLAPEIRVNAICPGFIDTPWWSDKMDEDAYRAFVARIEKSTPLRKASGPEDIAGTVVWFIEGGDHITGETLLVDAGLHLGAQPRIGR
jgi:3-oxoacyl-[acyl-carrier protein] reductase